jgi:hypothetical protein
MYILLEEAGWTLVTIVSGLQWWIQKNVTGQAHNRKTIFT